MRRRLLGRTGLSVSEIGFGGWGLGGVNGGATSYGPVDDDASARALRHALDAGVTFFDTADLYGHGHSEQVLGEVLRSRRSEVVMASKVGFLDADGSQDFSPAHLRRAIEGSLRRLRTDYLDVYQLHNPPLEAMTPDDPAVREMHRLRREGVIRAFGISLRSPADGFAAVRDFGAEVVQVNFNLIDQRAFDIGLLDECAQRGVGVIGRTPLCYGFLTGKYSGGETFADGDHRQAWPLEQRRLWAGAPAVFEPVRARQAQTAGQFALRYCLSYDAISTVIPGMLDVAQVDENVSASSLGALPAAEREEIERLYRQHRFFIARPAPAAAVRS